MGYRRWNLKRPCRRRDFWLRAGKESGSCRHLLRPAKGRRNRIQKSHRFWADCLGPKKKNRRISLVKNRRKRAWREIISARLSGLAGTQVPRQGDCDGGA